MEYWFKDGLRFGCQGCGFCCTIPDGYVYIHPSEIEEMREYLDLTLEEFSRLYVEKLDGDLVLKSFPNGECIFYKDGGCRIYDARPRQCMTYPFWPHNLGTKYDWAALGQECPGINKGRKWSEEEIIQCIQLKMSKD